MILEMRQQAAAFYPSKTGGKPPHSDIAAEAAVN
jgi:hypothetical protein